MFLSHIQLIFSTLVKTWKIEKCFMAATISPDKLAFSFHHPHSWKHAVNKGSYMNIL